VDLSRCEQALEREEQPHIEREFRGPLTLVETSGKEFAPPDRFGPEDGELAVYEMLFMRPVRTPWLADSVVAPIMVPDELPEFPAR